MSSMWQSGYHRPARGLPETGRLAKKSTGETQGDSMVSQQLSSALSYMPYPFWSDQESRDTRSELQTIARIQRNGFLSVLTTDFSLVEFASLGPTKPAANTTGHASHCSVCGSELINNYCSSCYKERCPVCKNIMWKDESIERDALGSRHNRCHSRPSPRPDFMTPRGDNQWQT